MSVVRFFFVAFATALLLCTAAHCQDKPTITYVSQAQIQELGSSVQLVCKVQNSQDYPVMWLKVGKTEDEVMFISTNGALVTRDSRYSLRADPSTSTFTLRIDDIQEIDAGPYQCQIPTSPQDKVTAQVELKLRRAPTFSDNSTRSLLVGEGQSAELQCYAEGYPEPQISWRRENNAKLPNGNSIFYGNVLRIDEVRKEHRGTYHCLADNGVGGFGRGARRNVVLNVEFAPTIQTKRPRLGQALQRDVDLTCHVIAYPPPAITWHKDDQQLANNRRYGISHFSTDEDYDSTLRIVQIERTQFGDYVCRAVNKLGSAETKVQLFETDVPVCPPACGPVVNSTTPDQENKATP